MSELQRKRGALSTEEQDFIRNNCSTMSVKDMAIELGRKEDPINRYIEKHNLNVEQLSVTDQQRLVLKRKLINKYYFPSIKRQLVVTDECDEVEIFINKWIDLMIQFKEDVLSSEEDQIIQLILLYINLERVRTQEARSIKRILKLEDALLEEYKTDPVFRDVQTQQNIASMEAELQTARSLCASYTGQIKVINHDLQVLNKDLKSTRDQRFAKIDSGDKTFIGLIRRLQDDKHRQQISREAELMRLATDKKRKELYAVHVYADGGVDIPILNKESAKFLEEKDVEEQPQDIKEEEA